MVNVKFIQEDKRLSYNELIINEKEVMEQIRKGMVLARGEVSLKEAIAKLQVMGIEDINYNTLCRYENGTIKSVPPRIIMAYSQIFNTSLDKIYFGKELKDLELRKEIARLHKKYPV